ncbi:hypothetical protein QKU48_gp0440 [Fadolivirus algeromassiliense]|jgi:hypothetical protein|uniref:Uncharacterized protein n=1 Tax=Fadolivirus FV1/VV64 TaxID=3070911 RepID=A0A7D3R1L9_9VIRU|nr:hypothetical protein QKU48_gp0440 [Fadolivirus algeromassiliense]QKF93898.1 hypothetical protein Fadolivirus_1_440 [Fadolivirus FV1/VV64]
MSDKLISRKKARKLLRYLILFLSVFISSQYIPECSVGYQTSFIMATVASVAFVIIDMYFPVLADN